MALELDKQQSITVTPKPNCNVNSTDNNPPFHSRRKVGGFFAELLHGRKTIPGYLLFFVLLYVSGLIIFVDPISAIFYTPSLPGSVYKSHQIFDNLWPQIQSDNSSAIQLSSVWKYKRKLKEQKRCLNTYTARRRGRRRHLGRLGPDYYLIVDANGGLNQQRSSVCCLTLLFESCRENFPAPSLNDFVSQIHMTLLIWLQSSQLLPPQLLAKMGAHISIFT